MQEERHVYGSGSLGESRCAHRRRRGARARFAGKMGWSQGTIGRGAKNVGKEPEQNEEIRGFLVYVTRKYIGLAPYLIGIYMMIDGWRTGRDAEGWRHQKVVVKSGEEDG
jgi:hypothetical protein